MKFASILAMALLFTSCGDKIDQRFLEKANQLVGTYEGQFVTEGPGYTFTLNGVKAAVEIKDGMPLLIFSEDMAGKNCGSSVGTLQSAAIDIFNNNIGTASFGFNSGKCKIYGTILDTEAEIQEDGNVSLTTSLILKVKRYPQPRGSILKATLIKGNFAKVLNKN